MSTLTSLETALLYHDRGWFVFPCRGNEYPRSSHREKKRPMPGVRWQKDYPDGLRPTRDQVVEWWTKWPNAWIGCALGRVSDLVRVDADGAEALLKFQGMGGATEPTLEFLTINGGHGFLYRYLPTLRTEQWWKGTNDHEELRVQSDGAYTILPSPDSGYFWLTDVEPVRVPEWLRERTTARVLVILERELFPGLLPMQKEPDLAEVVEALQHIDADDRETWLYVGMGLHSMDAPLSLWDDWSKKSEKYTVGECERCWNNFRKVPGGVTSRTIAQYARRNGWIQRDKWEALTDVGNSATLARFVVGRIKHDGAVGWLAWDGRRWKTGPDAEKELIRQQSIQLLERVALVAAAGSNLDRNSENYEKEHKRWAAFHKQVSFQMMGPRMREVRLLTKADHRIACSIDEFDDRPMELNCTNGTLDLRTFGTRRAVPEDLVTQLCPTEYDPSAECLRWLRFIDEVFGGDKELSDWAQKLLGYCLTGRIDLHILPILWGAGRNGKTTLVNTVRYVMGPDYSTSTPSGFLAMMRNQSHTTDIVDLRSKRFVVDAETGDGVLLNEERVKKMTGDEKVKGRRLYENNQEFSATWKLFVMTNHEPVVRGTDDAIWGRMLKIPFTQSFLDREEPGLKETLEREASGILTWLVEGCRRWQCEGLRPYPSAVVTATTAYRQEQNVITLFFDENLVKDSQASVPVKAVKAAYEVWCHRKNIRPVSNKIFGVELKKWFSGEVPWKHGDREYRGVKLSQ